MKACPGCGTIGGGLVCQVCGTELSTPTSATTTDGESLWRSAAVQAPATTTPPSPSVPVAPAGGATTGIATVTATAPPPSGARGRGLLIGAALVVVGLAGGFYLASRGGETTGTALDQPASTEPLVLTTPAPPPSDVAAGAGTVAQTPSPTTAVVVSLPAADPSIPVTTIPATTAPAPPPTTIPLDPEAQAFLDLVGLIESDAPTVAAVAENWVPQLGAKQNGTVWQGTTYNFQAILADHLQMRDTYGAVLVAGGTYNFKLNGQPMDGWFISLVPEPYTDPSGALGWCTASRIDRDNCLAKLLTNNQDAGDTIELNT